MSIRLASVAKIFRDGGLELVSSWTPMKSLTKEQRDTLRDRHGRWIKVHPDDRGKLAALRLLTQTDADGNPHLDMPLVDDDGATTTDKTPKGAKTPKGKE